MYPIQFILPFVSAMLHKVCVTYHIANNGLFYLFIIGHFIEVTN